MKLTNFLLISSLFVAVLFFMSACDNAVGSKLPAINASSGRENYCRVDGDCSPDGYIGAYFCQNGDVYRNFRDYSCVSRVCTYNTNAMLIDDCGTNETCVNGMAECQPVTNQTSHKICSGNSCVTVQGAGSNECNVNGDCQVNQTYFTYTLEYDVSIDISEAGGNYSSYTSQPGYYLHTTTQDSIKLVQEGVFTDKLWIVYEPEIFANRLFYEDSTGHTKEAMTFRNGNEEQTLNFVC